jgi:hypothetical protein
MPKPHRLAVFALLAFLFTVCIEALVPNLAIDAPATIAFGLLVELLYPTFGVRQLAADWRAARRAVAEDRRQRETGENGGAS